jgi:hypothetical protein
MIKEDEKKSGVESWDKYFEKIIGDKEGIKKFDEFLKKELSNEKI